MKKIFRKFLILTFVFLGILSPKAYGTTNSTDSVTSEDSVISEMNTFTLPPPSTVTGEQLIWMTNYERISTPVVTDGSGKTLKDVKGQTFVMTPGGTIPISVSEKAFCSGANNSILLVETPNGRRVFATTGPIKIVSANCENYFSNGLSKKIMNTLDHQSFDEVTECAPFGLDARGHALVPYRSIAVKDGGPIKIGELLFVPELVGLPLRGPNNKQLISAQGVPLIHDGYVIAVDHVDSGKNTASLPEIYHVDLFIGDQKDLLSEGKNDQSFKLFKVEIVRNVPIQSALLDSATCPLHRRPNQ